MEDVWASQHGEGGEVSAEGPAADAHSSGVDIVGVRRCHGLEGSHLVLERRRREVAAHRAIPRGSSARRTAAIGHDDDVALVGKPLIGAVREARCDHEACMRAAVRRHDDGKSGGTGYVARGEEHSDVEVALASAHEMDLR